MEAPSSCPVYMHALISMAHHWSQATRGTGTAVKVVLFDHTPIKILGPVFCSYAHHREALDLIIREIKIHVYGIRQTANVS